MAFQSAGALLKVILVVSAFVVIFAGCAAQRRYEWELHEIRSAMYSSEKLEPQTWNRQAFTNDMDAERIFKPYDARLCWAIEKHWYQELARHKYPDNPSLRIVRIEFLLHSDGRVTNTKVARKQGAGNLEVILARRAIVDLVPFPPWPDSMKKILMQEEGKDYREVGFTFYYKPRPSPQKTPDQKEKKAGPPTPAN